MHYTLTTHRSPLALQKQPQLPYRLHYRFHATCSTEILQQHYRNMPTCTTGTGHLHYRTPYRHRAGLSTATPQLSLQPTNREDYSFSTGTTTGPTLQINRVLQRPPKTLQLLWEQSLQVALQKVRFRTTAFAHSRTTATLTRVYRHVPVGLL